MPNSDLNGCQTLVFDHFRFKQRFKHRFKHKFKHRFKHRLKHLIMYKVVPYKTGRHRHLKASVQKPYPESRREVSRPSVNLAPKKYSRKGKVTEVLKERESDRPAFQRDQEPCCRKSKSFHTKHITAMKDSLPLLCAAVLQQPPHYH